MERALELDPISVDVSTLLDRSVASLYSYLVTRPTGRAVRLAIEGQLLETDRATLFLIDLSEVRVLDFSCADEVVAKLLLRYLGTDRPRDVFFVFRGLQEPHRDPIEAVLQRHQLAAVAETAAGGVELLGSRTSPETKVWETLQSRGRVGADEVARLFPEVEDRSALDRLAERRVVFQRPDSGDYHALGALIR